MDLSALLEAYRQAGSGNVAYHPALMCKLLLYAYATGTFSSRKIAQAGQTDIALRILAAGDPPRHRTIARFRKRRLEALQALFVQVVGLARGAGLGTLGTLAVDGSKVRGSASKHKAMSYERMKEEDRGLKAEIEALTRRAEDLDAAEDEALGEDVRGDELPQEIQRREDRRRVIREAAKRLRARKKEEAAADLAKEQHRSKEQGKPRTGRQRHPPRGKPKPKDQENFTDPDRRIMKAGGGFQQSDNAQIAVDGQERMIVAAEVTQCAADSGQLLPMVDAAESHTGLRVCALLADAGYRSEANVQALEK